MTVDRYGFSHDHDVLVGRAGVPIAIEFDHYLSQGSLLYPYTCGRMQGFRHFGRLWSLCSCRIRLYISLSIESRRLGLVSMLASLAIG